LENLKDVFRDLPTYKPGGWIKASDILVLVAAMEYPRTPEQVAAYQEYWEKNCGGILTMEAFVSSASSIYSTTQYARDYAVMFDKDGMGTISKDEFETLMGLLVKHGLKLEGKTFADFVTEADIDHDGKVRKLNISVRTNYCHKYTIVTELLIINIMKQGLK